MATELSRRGLLTGAMAAASLATFPFGGTIEGVADVSPEAATVPVAVSPFIVVMDEWGYYVDDSCREPHLSDARTDRAPINIEPSIVATMIDMMRAA
ncbi:hypothetical protein [Rhizobium sp. BK176]|uniref:hypothetical protein n=1 Tax=Rhizobium sp. BK176 TaxID=2587071 RepID=UPI00216A497B|nr:hypothetical protein [Rhizobium sp. BK176]MCS4088847.1 hypothetical protein [Rhizobium sp. BK176]